MSLVLRRCPDCLSSFSLFQTMLCLDHMSYQNLGNFHSLQHPCRRQELPPSPLVPVRRLWTSLQEPDIQTHWSKADTQQSGGTWSQARSVDFKWKAPSGGKWTNHWIIPSPGRTSCTKPTSLLKPTVNTTAITPASPTPVPWSLALLQNSPFKPLAMAGLQMRPGRVGDLSTASSRVMIACFI